MFQTTNQFKLFWTDIGELQGIFSFAIFDCRSLDHHVIWKGSKRRPAIVIATTLKEKIKILQ